MQLVLDARGHDADHAFVEVGVEHADGRRRLLAFVEQRLGDQQRLLAHVALDLAPLAVDAVQRARQFVGARRVVGQQAFDAQRHVGQPAGRVDARAQREAEVEGGGRLRPCAPAAVNRLARPQGSAPARMRLQALRHQAAVVGVELDHVGHRAERHQRQQRVELGLRLRASNTPRARSSARSASST